MGIVQIDGIDFFTNLNGPLFIIIDSNRIEECMRAYMKNNLYGIALHADLGYNLQDVDFLSEYPDIKHLSISDKIKDISSIHTLKSLVSLSVSGKNRKIDFSHFPLLNKIFVDWSPNLSNFDKCIELKTLSLFQYNPKSKDCTSISEVKWIENLIITQSTITTLKGLEKFDKLKKLEVSYCSKLDTLCGLEKSKETLVSLLFSNCKSIRNHEYVEMLKNLKY